MSKRSGRITTLYLTSFRLRDAFDSHGHCRNILLLTVTFETFRKSRLHLHGHQMFQLSQRSLGICRVHPHRLLAARRAHSFVRSCPELQQIHQNIAHLLRGPSRSARKTRWQPVRPAEDASPRRVFLDATRFHRKRTWNALTMLLNLGLVRWTAARMSAVHFQPTRMRVSHEALGIASHQPEAKTFRAPSRGRTTPPVKLRAEHAVSGIAVSGGPRGGGYTAANAGWC